MLGSLIVASIAAGTATVQVDPQWNEHAAQCGVPGMKRPEEELLTTVQLAADDALRRRPDTVIILLPCLAWTSPRKDGRIAEAADQIMLSVGEIRSLTAQPSWSDDLTQRFLTFTIAHERQHLGQPPPQCSSLASELEADRNARVPAGPLVMSHLLWASFGQYKQQARINDDQELPARCTHLLELSIRAYAHSYDVFVEHSTDASNTARMSRQRTLQDYYANREEIFELVLPRCRAAVEQSTNKCHHQQLNAIEEYRRNDPHGPPPPSWRSPALRGPIATFTDDARVILRASTGFGMHWIDEGTGGPRALATGPRVDFLSAIGRPARIGEAFGPTASYQAMIHHRSKAAHRLQLGIGSLLLMFTTSGGRIAHGVDLSFAWALEVRPGADINGFGAHAGWTSIYRARPRLHIFAHASYELVADIPGLRQSRLHSHGGFLNLGLSPQLGHR